MQQLSPQDAQFLYMETNKSFSQVTQVSIFDPSTSANGIVRFKDIIEHVRSRLHTSPIYKRRIYHVPLELDYPYWIEDEHFDIESHITHSRLPHPADWRQFCIHLARFHSRPLDLQRPPWEMYVIEGLENINGIPKGAYAIATKMHHAAADGMAIVNFIGGLTDIDAHGTPLMKLDKPISTKRYERPTPIQMALRGTINTIRSPMKVADTLMRSAPAIVRSFNKQISENKKETKRTVPNTRFNLETSPHRMFDATTFALSKFKPIRNMIEGCTTNDVVLAVCSGALRRYLIQHKELPAQSLRAFVPVNVRGRKSERKNKEVLGNNISTMSPTLHTNIANPLERLKAINAETKNHKAARAGISARLMTDVSKHIPASTQLLAARLVMSSELAGRATNVCISNVPGPSQPVYMNGAKMIRTIGLGPLADRMGLFIAVASYNGVMSFNITSCRRTLPDIEFFIECVRISFDELSDIASEFALKKVSEDAKAKVEKKKTEKAAKKKKTKKIAKKASKKANTTKSSKVAKKRKVKRKASTLKKASAKKVSARHL
ncbi:MAG: wax ester/triacylglycerol synthase family O-acyltransferase [Acidiferrobacterales bacterium]|nr:wax ester/triacylglycerol synthase family O-acyltransferase [Acidiferrobacterales bacterium]